MHAFTQRIHHHPSVYTSLTLPFELRQRSRLRVRLDNGEDAGLYLQRGTVLRDGDLLASDDGIVIAVRSAPEPVSSVYCTDPRQLARAAYHLGNRHVALQIGTGWVRYLHDHVLDAMVAGLGLTVTREQTAFEPEAGAYGASNHHHGHDHG